MVFWVREAAVVAVCVWIVRVCSALTLSVLLGMRMGYFGVYLSSSPTLVVSPKTRWKSQSERKTKFLRLHHRCQKWLRLDWEPAYRF